MDLGTHPAIPEHQLGVVLTVLRCARGWSQDDLSRESRIRNTSISDYERGRKVPELDTLYRLVVPMGYPLAAVDYTLRYLETLRAGSLALAPAARELPADPPPSPRPASRLWEIEQAAADLSRAVARFGRLLLVLLLDRHEGSEAPPGPGAGAPRFEAAVPSPRGVPSPEESR
jgi:transcriptional regulator with XRE-family HTH domain